MARTARAPAAVRPADTVPLEDLDPRLKGQVVFRPLDAVAPNTWNPNHMTEFQKASLRKGLQEDGWLVSQALLVWGTDEHGAPQNVIIDGEHRWTEGVALGFKNAPMVFLYNLPAAQAKALTIKLGTKRGQHDNAELSALLREIQFDLRADAPALDIGIENPVLMELLAEPNIALPADDPTDKPLSNPPGEVPSGMASVVKMVQLFFNKEQHEEFITLVKQLGARQGTKDVTSTVLEGMRRAAATA